MAPKRSRKEESEEESGAEETPVVTTKPSGSVTVPVPDKQTDAEGHTYFEISGKRRVTIRSFNGLKLVDIREMYTDKASGELKPGKKGISLSEEQFMGLVNVHGAITQALNELDVGSTSTAKRTSKPSKAKASTSKPTSKKKARQVESDEE